MLSRTGRILLLSLWLSCWATSASTQTTTQITLDGSIGAPAGVVGPTSPGVWELPGNLGARAGNNLFYSFGLFDIASNNTAVFLPDPMDPKQLSNVLARVTGGEPSDIDGTLRSLIPGADLYLLNPAGVLFGGASVIDVPRSLYVSTAHRLEFANGSDFLDLVDASNPTLSVQPPAAFGFDGRAPPAEIVFGNPGLTAKSYRVPDGNVLSAVGGDVRVSNRTRVQAFGGRVQIAAVGAALVEVPLDLADLDPADAATLLGEVRVEGQSTLDTAPFDPNTPQGTVVIRGGRFVLDDRSLVRGGGQLAGGGAAVDVAVAHTVTISNRSELRSEGQGAVASGGVRVSADEIDVSGDSIVRSRVFAFAPGAAPAGDVVLDANTIRIESGGLVEATTDGPSAGGDVVVTAGSLVLDDGELRTATNSTGSAGAVRIQADRVEIARGSIASTSSTSAFGGSIEITADEIELRGGESQIVTSNSVTAAPPPGDADMPEGGITLTADSIRVLDGGVVSTQTSGTRAGGNIAVTSDTLEILDGGFDAALDPRESAVEAGTSGSGAGGSIQVDVGDLRIGRSAGSDRAGRLATAVQALASGRSGDIDVAASSVSLEGGGQISTTTFGTGGSGSIRIVATGDVVLTGQDLADDGGTPLPSGIFTRAGTGAMLSSADAGSVRIEAADIDVLDGPEISTRAIGTGASGDVALIATGRVRVAGESGQTSAVTARALEGQGGDVIIESDVLEVTDGGRVDVSTDGSGTGGLLTVRTGDLIVRGESPGGVEATVTAQTGGLGEAQGIEIEASRSVRVERGGVITAQATFSGTAGSPGDVAITAPVIAVDGGRITTQAGSAAGGDITLIGGSEVTFNDGAELSARSAGGDAGNIVVSAPRVIVRDSQVIADADEFGGEITLRASEFILLERARMEAFSRGGGGPVGGTAGGNVFVLGGGVVLNQSSIVADGFGNANGGNVLLSGNPVLQSTDTTVSVSSDLALDGTFVVNSPYAEVTGDLASLPENFLDASALLEEACLARDAPSGSFAVRRVGELPASPDAPLELEAEDEAEAECQP